MFIKNLWRGFLMEKINSLKLSLTFVLTLFLFVGISFSTLAATGITITYPNGGEYINDETFINWTLTGTGTGLIDLQYSSNDGTVWTDLVTLAPGSLGYVWNTVAISDGDGANYTIFVIESGTSVWDMPDDVFTIDNTIPTSTITSPAASSWQGDDFAVSRTDVDATSGLATCEVRLLDNSVESLPWTTATCNADYIVDISTYCTTEGTDMCEAQIRSTDQAGNPSVEDNRIFSIDSIDPSTTDDYVLTGWQTSDQLITLTPADAAPSSGIVWTRYCVDTLDTCDPSSGTDYTVPVTVSTEGTNYFRYATQDNAGNVQTTVSKTVMIDKTNPTASVGGTPVGLIIDPSGVTATVECSDLESGCDTSSYMYQTFVADPAPCPAGPGGYTLGSSVNITSYSWVCSYVEDNAGNPDVSDSTEFNVFSTIQGAINAATGGETINVPAGSYTESLTIDKSLTLQGAGSSSTTINGVHTISADDVTIDGFTLAPVGSGIAVTIDSSASAIDNIDITNNIFTLTTSPSIGVWLGGGTPTNLVSDVTMSYNTFNGPTNKICNPWKIGGQFGSPLNTQVQNVDFDHNTIDRCSTPVNLQNSNVDDVLVDYNTFTNTDGVIYVWGEGTPTGILSDFVFTNNNVDSTNSYGVGIDLDGATVFGDSNFGTGNSVNFNNLTGIVGAYGFGAVSLLSTPATYTLNATHNYWGAADGPSGAGSGSGSPVSADVDYSPWAYTSGFDYDLINPTTVINTPTNSSWQGTPSFDVSLTDSDTGGSGLSLCRYRVRSFNGATWDVTKNLGDRTCSVSVNLLVGNTAGDHCEEEGENACKIEAFAIDVAGNTGDTVSRFFSIDWTAPTTTDSGTDTNWHSSDVTVTLTPTDTSGSGVANTYYCVDQADSCTPTTAGTSVVVSTEGTNYVRFYSVDNVGNAETVTSATNTVKIDKLHPSTADIEPGDISVQSGIAIPINATVIDSYSGILSVDLNYEYLNGTIKTLSMSNVGGDTYAATVPAQETSTTLTYDIETTDNIGNSGNSTSYTITIKDLVWNLDSEWNLVSTPKTLSTKEVSTLIPSNTLWIYDVSTDTWVNPTTVYPGVGYWADNSPLTELGLDYEDECSGPGCGPSETITIYEGWNLLGHMCTINQDVLEAFPQEVYSNMFVLRYDEASDEFQVYSTYDPDNREFLEVTPGEGYWVFIPSGSLLYTNFC